MSSLAEERIGVLPGDMGASLSQKHKIGGEQWSRCDEEHAPHCLPPLGGWRLAAIHKKELQKWTLWPLGAQERRGPDPGGGTVQEDGGWLQAA